MPILSVIIPAWNEAPLIRDAVASAAKFADEVIVVDGHSTDGTASAAKAAGARVIMSAKGRGPQLHAGALAARGEILLFLHADARLPPMARAAILRRLSDPGILGGNFLLKFLPSSWFTRILAPFNDLRRLITRRYYGDSGIFVRREVYHRLGGFPSYPLMEDYDFSTKLQRAGRCVYIRDIWVTASDRRFRGKELRTLLLWMSLQILYWLRVPARVLYKAYPDIRSDERQRFIAAYRQQFEEKFRLRDVSLA